ncbi:MAG: sortase [Anaerolineae bacterium]|jgi:sortase A
MKKMIPALSRAMLILGGLMILAGLGWGVWMRVNAPPDPEFTDAGAVVLAVTAPVELQPVSPTPTEPPPTPTSAPTSTPTSTEPPRTEGPTPALLPDWTVTPEPTPTTTDVPATDVPPTPTPTPTPTSLPPAEEPPVRVVAPAIELDAKVVPMGWEMVDRRGAMVSEWKVPAKAAGWHMNSALPGHGENVVISGHHNIEGKVFRYVVDLEPGDKITLYAGDTEYEYYVSEKYILKEAGMPLKVRQRNAQWIMPSGDERLTLVTCWPYEWPGNTHRVIVVARPPSYYESLSDTAVEDGVQ